VPKDSITFIWHGKDYRGKSAHGRSRTRDEDSLRTSLRQQGIKLIHAETAPPVLQQLMNIAIRRFSLDSKLRTQHRVKKSDISHILQQLAMLLQAGIPILQCFNTLNHGQKKPAIRNLLTAIKKELESGISLADSLRRQGNNFDPILCNLIALGEHSGSLNRVLEKIVQHRSKLEELQRNIRRALIYPCTILMIAFIVVLILFIWVVPQFEKLFIDFGAELPSYTRLLIQFSHAIKAYSLSIIGTSIILIGTIRYSYQNNLIIRRHLDIARLHIPIFGKAYHCSLLARFNRTLSTLFGAGLPLVDCLDKLSMVMPNLAFQEACTIIAKDIRAGESLSASFKKIRYFTPLMQDMVRTGEESGSLLQLLSNLSEIYENELEQWVAGMNSLLEPLIISLLGLIVGSLVLAMYLPIFKLSSII